MSINKRYIGRLTKINMKQEKYKNLQKPKGEWLMNFHK